MVSVNFYFQIHQPNRLRNYSVFDIHNNHDYFDNPKNREILERVAKKCYLPTTKLILDLIQKTDGKFKASYSISGVALDQLEQFSPEVIDLFKELSETGCVDFLSETYHHSLSFLYSKEEFKHQVELHKQKIKDLFNYNPQVFRNTELIYNNELAYFIEDMGYKGILAEGADNILHWRSPNFMYKPINSKHIKLMLKNYRLSDDIAFRFSERTWKEFPLTTDKFSQWVNKVNGNGEIINLFMDYETFGEHQWAQTGIFRFLKHLPVELLNHPDNDFTTPTEAVGRFDPKDEIDIHHPISWADVERDLSAWLGNRMQQEALHQVYEIESQIKNSNDPELIKDWRLLQTSDHYYYMCTKWFADGDVHKYFNPYESPYDGFIIFNNVLNDIKGRLKSNSVSQTSQQLNEKNTLENPV